MWLVYYGYTDENGERIRSWIKCQTEIEADKFIDDLYDKNQDDYTLIVNKIDIYNTKLEKEITDLKQRLKAIQNIVGSSVL